MKNTVLMKLVNIDKIFHIDRIETHALSNINLEINKGDYISITGPSGCGKSTLLSMLGLLDTPSNGEFWLNGIDVSQFGLSSLAKIRNQEIGFIFQDFNLIGDLTVFENIELPLTYRGIKKSIRKEMVEKWAERVGMSSKLQHNPSQLSGGQQQRAAIARALVGEPSVLLADEPTGNLDSKNGVIVMQLLKDLNDEGVTICMVTHDKEHANATKTMLTLLDGKIVDLDTSNLLSAEVA
ncbi:MULTISPECIES: ABC transporter ATP-binding protein [unclassified Colwellia]|uniref:ABC transporter ATP-binding protein n=1 Tax=unclassified Colwellia TaxID=196834 RepID=UPI0015F625D5|nr:MULTISPECIES: ABC transporter ATP-binding protein [unclassified Colwellia]MBA6257676.1 ABC transporter ATP-binding protein [Colwellia sp. MB3u-28]MBA6259433.1 ABC transporter ATP-binding protein [Colwellia sp. MB3u-41]MBA6304364.1 ABC transporter ATP-binding protein [Colwellia sp. MB02u-14]